MTIPFTIPPPNKVAGVSTGLTADLDSLYAAAGVLTLWNVQNAAYSGGAAGDGTTDDTAAIQAAITAAGSAGGGIVYLPAGTYKVSSPLTAGAGNITIRGAGPLATVIVLAAGFTGAAVITAASRDNCTVEKLAIAGASSTYSSNPAAAGIQVTTSNFWTLRDLYFQYLNGYAVELKNSAVANCYFPVLDNCQAEKCASGFHLLGDSAGNIWFGAFLSNCNADQCQSGDCYLFENAGDITAVNLEGYPAAGTGRSIHLKGAQFAYFTNCDIGASGAPAECVLCEAGGGSISNYAVSFTGCLFQKGTAGLSVTNGTGLKFTNCDFLTNQGNGATISSGTDILISNCWFAANGQTAAAGHYDLNATTTGKIVVSGNIFATPQGTGSGQVQWAATFNSSASYLVDNYFEGASGANAVNSFPNVMRGNIGLNPVGNQGPPAVPASGTPLSNSFAVDCMVYITAGSSTCAVAVGGSAMVTIPASGIGSAWVPAGQSVTLTYTNAPTWKWYGT